MMEYFKMTCSTGNEIGRDFPQLHCLTQFDAHQLNAWEFPAFKPQLKFELNKTAKLTDVLSNAAISGFGLIMNRKAKEVFSRFKLMTHQFYEAKIILPETNEILDYHYFHPCNPQLSMHLDYQKSIFYATKWAFREDVITIKSYDHYTELKSNDKEAKFGAELDEIYVSDKFDKSLDLFVFLPFSMDIFVSRPLKEELEQNGIKGLSFEDATEIKI